MVDRFAWKLHFKVGFLFGSFKEVAPFREIRLFLSFVCLPSESVGEAAILGDPRANGS